MSITRMKNTEASDKVRAPRFKLRGNLQVKSKTIGTMLSYQMSTDDVSTSGLLLSWDHNATIPFRENTLLELEIDPQGTLLGKPLWCMGKVARRFNAEDNHTKFGISIVQMDNESMKSWETCLEQITTSNMLNTAA